MDIWTRLTGSLWFSPFIVSAIPLDTNFSEYLHKVGKAWDQCKVKWNWISVNWYGMELENELMQSVMEIKVGAWWNEKSINILLILDDHSTWPPVVDIILL